MSDNTGKYTSVAQLLVELANAGKATMVKIVLSTKTLISGTKYSFVISSTLIPAVGDFICQGEFHGTITSVVGTVIEVDSGVSIATGGARLVRSDYLEYELEKFIKDAMDFIDRHTRQWFNARTFSDNNPIVIEGNNSRVLFLPVPIISITAIKKAPESEILPSDSYTIFNGRTIPDDRRNPMIKLQKDSDDVLFISYGKWMRGQRINITGVFGFLEQDGTTPSMVSKATLKLALMNAIKTLGESAALSSSTGNMGAIKREKTDMHEIEYYDANSSTGQNSGTGLSGDDFVDDVIAAYKGPIIVDGTYPDIGLDAPVLASITGRED